MPYFGGGIAVFEGTGLEELFQESAEAFEPGSVYRVSLTVDAIQRGSLCVWVGGTCTKHFSTAGLHTDDVIAKSGNEIRIHGINALAEISLISVRKVKFT